MSLALDIVQARINLESKDPSLAEALATFKQHGVFPPSFVYRGFKFVKFSDVNLERYRKLFARVLNDIKNRDEDEDYVDTREFEYINHGCKIHGFDVSIMMDGSSNNDDQVIVDVADDTIGRPTRVNTDAGRQQLAQLLDAAIEKTTNYSKLIPSWASSPMTIMGERLDPSVDIEDDNKLTINFRNRQMWLKKIVTVFRWTTGSPHISISVTAQPRGATSKRSFDFKLPVSVAEAGQLPAKIREYMAAKNVFQSAPKSALTTVTIDVGDVKRSFEVRDAVAFKKHLLQYLKGN